MYYKICFKRYKSVILLTLYIKKVNFISFLYFIITLLYLNYILKCHSNNFFYVEEVDIKSFLNIDQKTKLVQLFIYPKVFK